MTSVFDCFKERAAVVERMETPLWMIGYVTFDEEPYGVQYRYNDFADTLIATVMPYLELGMEEGYIRCGSKRERAAYCICLEFGARWERLPRIAVYLHDFDFAMLTRHNNDGWEPRLPLGDDYKKGIGN